MSLISSLFFTSHLWDFLFPVIGNVLLPFIFWMLKREEINGINKHGKDILNGQLTYSIVMSILFFVQFLIMFLPLLLPTWHFSFEMYKLFPFYALGGVLVCAALFGIFPGLNAMRVYQGKDPWKYPLKITFFKWGLWPSGEGGGPVARSSDLLKRFALLFLKSCFELRSLNYSHEIMN